MPSTLIHIGLQGAVAHAVWRRADLLWVYTGCVIPDLPWMACRVVARFPAMVTLLDLRLYGAGQATLIGCLLLCGAVAAFAASPGAAFGLMASASLIHLLMDAAESKWGGGVHLLAPFDWRPLSWDLVSTDGTVITLAAIASAILVAIQWRSAASGGRPLRWPTPRRALVGVLCLAAWLVLPLRWMGSVEASGFLDAPLLRDPGRRAGQALRMDRVTVVRESDRVFTVLANGERIAIEGPVPPEARMISAVGVFLSPDRLRVDTVQTHHAWSREAQTIVGLAVVAILWLVRAR